MAITNLKRDVLVGIFGNSAESRKRMCLYLCIDFQWQRKELEGGGLWSKGMRLSLDPCHGSQMLL